MFHSWLMEHTAGKRNFKCIICQSSLELGNMGRGALVKHCKSVKHKRNLESRKSSSASMLASWSGAQNPHVTNLTDNEPTSDIEHANELSLTNYPFATAPAPPSQNVDILNQDRALLLVLLLLIHWINGLLNTKC